MHKGSGTARSASEGFRKTCPSCNAIVQEGDIVCVACGTNLLTGQKIAEKRSQSKSSLPAFPAINRGVWIAAAAVIAVIVLAGAAYGTYAIMRDPVNQAMRLVDEGRLSEANRILEGYVRDNPESARGLFALGRLQWETRQYSRAAETFERLTQVDPRNREAGMLALLSLRVLNDPGNRARKVALLERQVDRFPDDDEAWYLLALARGAQGDVQGQVEALQQALARGIIEEASMGYLGVGLALQGEYTQAQRMVLQVLEDDPDNADLQAALGFIAHMQGDEDTATERLRAAIAQGTELEREARTQLGLLLVRRGEYAEALDHLEVIAGRPGAPQSVRYFQAVSKDALGRRTQALDELERLSNEQGEFAGYAAAHVAQIYLDRGQPDRASSALERATRAGVEDAMVYTLRGRVFAEEGNDSQARDMFRQAIQMDPDYAPARLEMGLMQIKRRAFADGIRELERYIALADPAQPNARVDEVETLVEQLRRTAGAEATREASRTMRTSRR